VLIADAMRPSDAATAAAMAQRALLEWHGRFSRFDPQSELSAFNRDPRFKVPVSPLLRRLVEAAVWASRETGGLVDATLGAEIERAGYAAPMYGDGIPLSQALARAPARAPATSSPADRWCQISVDPRQGAVTRPPGLVLDLGGIAKGVFADELATLLAGFDGFAVDCAGDLRVGGKAGALRQVHVASPFDDSMLHSFALDRAAVATSGIGRRSWLTDDGRPAHHLLDPGTGAPAFTGVVQATALAPTAAEAEVLAKAAVLSGPGGATEWLTHGGALVYDDGSYVVLEPATAEVGTRSEIQVRRSASTSSRSGSLTIS
jgi:thiamine biosynthesis lipoprotein